MSKNVEISTYTYHLFSSRAEDDAALYLYDKGSNVVAEVFFVDDGDPLPAPQRTNGKHALYYHRGALPAVVDMLRNEGPVYLRWHDDQNVSLSTEYEPVGDGESD